MTKPDDKPPTLDILGSIRTPEDAERRLREHQQRVVREMEEWAASRAELLGSLRIEPEEPFCMDPEMPNGDPSAPDEIGLTSWADFVRACDAVNDEDLSRWKDAAEALSAAAREFGCSVWVTLGLDVSLGAYGDDACADWRSCVRVTDIVTARQILEEHGPLIREMRDREDVKAEQTAERLAELLRKANAGRAYTRAEWRLE